MALEMFAAGVGILILAVAWYGLQIVALRDLRERPSVRGENKLLWAFAILCLPYAGALGYLTFGPTSFLPRTDRRSSTGQALARTRSVRSIPGTNAPAEPSFTARSAAASPARPERLFDGSTRPATSGRQLAHDPVIGTDSSDLLPTRLSVARGRRPGPDAIRWPGSAIPPSYQPANAELHD